MLIISTTTTSSNQIKRHLRLTRQIFMHKIHIFLFLNVKYLFIAAVNLVAPFYIAHSYSVCSLSPFVFKTMQNISLNIQISSSCVTLKDKLE